MQNETVDVGTDENQEDDLLNEERDNGADDTFDLSFPTCEIILSTDVEVINKI